jgi:hypothetical protein
MKKMRKKNIFFEKKTTLKMFILFLKLQNIPNFTQKNVCHVVKNKPNNYNTH